MDDKIVIVDENGNEVEMDVLFTFESDENSKQYVLYYNPEDEAGTVFASSYDDSGNLYDVQSDAEWEMIEEVFNTFLLNEVLDEQDDHCHHHHHDGHCHHHHD